VLTHAESIIQLQDQIRERDGNLARHRSDYTALSEKCEELRRQANSEVAKIRAANATDHEAELMGERDQLMVSNFKCNGPVFLTVQ
jgi:septal ring factor EnvC (AmiA/AmiB activator)